MYIMIGRFRIEPRMSLTLLDTVLLGTLVVLILLLAGDALDALVEVVLVGGALSGVGALWM